MMLLIAAVVNNVAASTVLPDCLAGRWYHIQSAAMAHPNSSGTNSDTTPIWNNNNCVYNWQPDGTDKLRFDSPLGCIDDQWKGQMATIHAAGGSELTFQFVYHNRTVAMTGQYTSVGEHCSGAATVDMSDGSLYVRVSTHPFFMPHHEWIRVASTWLVRAAQISFTDGTRHLTPGYPTAYNGQWMRDGFYGISMLWPVANDTHRAEFGASAEWMFGKARPQDGVMPQACFPPEPQKASSECQYGQANTPAVNNQFFRRCTQANSHSCQDLDSGAFAVKLAHKIWSETRTADDQHAFFARWAPTLERALNTTTKDPGGTGLLWSNTTAPNVGYGFQDTIVKSGVVLYSNLLYWNATGLLGAMAATEGDHALATRMATVRTQIKRGVDRELWNSSSGIFLASTGIESGVVDVWGNALAAATGFASLSQTQSIFDFFKRNQNTIFFEGQVRETAGTQHWAMATGHLPSGAMDAAGGTVVNYQNGGFWATPLHHVLPFLERYDRGMACALLNQSIASFRSHGINEWVGPFYPAAHAGAPGYVASAAAVYFSSEHLRCWEY